MSEPEQEPLADPESPEEPETAPEPDEEEEEDEEGTEEPAEPSEPEAEPTPQSFSEKELEKGRKRLEAEETRHRNRIAEIMGEEALFLIPCPLCSDFVSGLIFPQVPPEDVVTATLAAVGLADVRDLEPASDAKQCPECKGKGRTKTGALIGEFASKKCATCRGIGWTRPDGSAVLDLEAPEGAGDALVATANGDTDIQPLIEALQGRGYFVAPPPQIPGAVS